MARQELTLNKMTKFNVGYNLDTPLFQEVYAGVSVQVSQQECDKMVLLFHSESGSTDGHITIKAGDGIQGVKDLTVPVPKQGYVAVCIESGRFKIMSGTDKGKILIDGSEEVGVMAIELP